MRLNFTIFLLIARLSLDLNIVIVYCNYKKENFCTYLIVISALHYVLFSFVRV